MTFTRSFECSFNGSLKRSLKKKIYREKNLCCEAEGPERAWEHDLVRESNLLPWEECMSARPGCEQEQCERAAGFGGQAAAVKRAPA